MRQGGLGRGGHAFLRHILQAVTDVVPHRVVEQNIFLGHHGNLLAERLDGHTADVDAIDADGAGGRLVEARQQIDQGGFSRTARTDQSDHFSPARAQTNVPQNDGSVASIGKTHGVEFDFARERRQRPRAGLLAFFFLLIQIRKHLGAGALRILKLLINLADALQRHVGVEHGVKKGQKNAGRHLAGLDLVARVQKEQRNDDGAEQVHQRRGGHRGAHPAHALAQQAARSLAELADLEILHAEGFDHAVSADRLLQNLAELAEAALAAFRGVTDLSAEFSDGKNDQGKHHAHSEGHLPIDVEHHREKDNQRETFLKEIREIFGERDARFLDVVDDRRQHTTRRVMLEKSDGLTDDFCVDVIAQVGDGRVPGVLNFGYAEIFGDAFENENHHERDAEDGPHMVNARREKLIEVDGAAAGNGKEGKLRAGRRGGQHVVPRDARHESDEALGDGDESHKNDADGQSEGVWPDVAEKAF